MEFYIEGEIKDDDLSGKVYGVDDQLDVLGWVFRNKHNVKVYAVKCKICANDAELFQSGIFLMSRLSLMQDREPCGCSKNRRYTEEQYKILCKRKFTELGYEFIDFAEPFHGMKTKLRARCDKHGVWESTMLFGLLDSDNRCSKCCHEERAIRVTLSDEDLIKSVVKTGLFNEGTKFTISDRIFNRKARKFLNVYCPICEDSYEALVYDLRKGKKRCACGSNQPKQAYLSILKDNGVPVAAKFGITNNYSRRVRTQERLGTYEVEEIGLWEFENSYLCNKAEKACKDTLSCGIVSRNDFSDGYTETTKLDNIDKIVKIYEEYGGVSITDEYMSKALLKDINKAILSCNKLLKHVDFEYYESVRSIRQKLNKMR